MENHRLSRTKGGLIFRGVGINEPTEGGQGGEDMYEKQPVREV